MLSQQLWKIGEIFAVRGETKGKIAIKYGKLGKLTYSPIFIADGFDCVMSEMKDEDLKVTHREKAFIEVFKEINKREIMND